jgi:hypothetical protein
LDYADQPRRRATDIPVRVGLLILIPFFAFRTLGEVVREHNLIRLFFEHRRRAASQ